MVCLVTWATTCKPQFISRIYAEQIHTENIWRICEVYLLPSTERSHTWTSQAYFTATGCSNSFKHKRGNIHYASTGLRYTRIFNTLPLSALWQTSIVIHCNNYCLTVWQIRKHSMQASTNDKCMLSTAAIRFLQRIRIARNAERCTS